MRPWRRRSTGRSEADVAVGLSRGDRLLLVLVLALSGVAVAADLTAEWYRAANSTWCDVSSYFSCTRVRASTYAAVAGIPTAVIGMGGFGVLAVLSWTALRGRVRIGRWSIRRWIMLFSAIGAAIGLSLSLLEVFVIQAVCILCAVGFALDLAILAVGASLLRTET